MTIPGLDPKFFSIYLTFFVLGIYLHLAISNWREHRKLRKLREAGDSAVRNLTACVKACKEMAEVHNKHLNKLANLNPELAEMLGVEFSRELETVSKKYVGELSLLAAMQQDARREG